MSLALPSPSTDTACVGRGPDGEHCCQFDGADCRFLTGGRCSLYDQWGRLTDLQEWRDAPVGQWFAANHPGYECRDWPQAIPEVMGNPTVGKCCWEVN